MDILHGSVIAILGRHGRSMESFGSVVRFPILMIHVSPCSWHSLKRVASWTIQTRQNSYRIAALMKELQPKSTNDCTPVWQSKRFSKPLMRAKGFRTCAAFMWAINWGSSTFKTKSYTLDTRFQISYEVGIPIKIPPSSCKWVKSPLYPLWHGRYPSFLSWMARIQ